LLVTESSGAIPIRAVKVMDFPENTEAHVSKAQAAWLKTTGWRAKAGAHVLLPNESGLGEVLFALGDDAASAGDALQLGNLPAALPEGTYKLVDFPGDPAQAVFAWLLGAYSFRRYFTAEPEKPRKLVLPKGVDRNRVIAQAQAIWFARELINIPANDLG